MTKTTDPTLTIEFQRKLDAFVQREVVYCVSHLVSEILPAAMQGYIGGSSFNEDDAYKLAGRTYWVPVEDDGSEWPVELESEEDCQTWIDANRSEECYTYTPEERTDEALEHWIVSDYLADRLEEHGEIIVRDFFGLTIWGRCCSGQAISMDGVIQEIYKEMMA
jgi:hypothetical protein